MNVDGGATIVGDALGAPSQNIQDGLAMAPSKAGGGAGNARLSSSLRSIKKKVEEAAADAKLRRERDDEKALELTQSLNALPNNTSQIIPRLNPSIKSKAAERRDIVSRDGTKTGTGRPRVRSANANLASKETVGNVVGGRNGQGSLRSQSGHPSILVRSDSSVERLGLAAGEGPEGGKKESTNRSLVKANKQHAGAGAGGGKKIPDVVTSPKHKKVSMFSETFPKGNKEAGAGVKAGTEGIGASRTIGPSLGLGGVNRDRGDSSELGEAGTAMVGTLRASTKTLTKVDAKSGVVIISTAGDSPDNKEGVINPGEGNSSSSTLSVGHSAKQKVFVPPISFEAIANRGP